MSLFRMLTLAGALLAASHASGAWCAEPDPQIEEKAPKEETPREQAPKEEAPKSTSVNVRSIIPRWGLGDSWMVETVNRRIQARTSAKEATLVEPIQWHFAVSRFEKTLAHDCFRIEVSPRGGEGRQPRTVLWIDRATLALRRVTTEIPTLEGFQEITVNYEFDSGQPAPVLGPLTALPIDMPVFLAGRAKGLETFGYTLFHGDAEKKDLDQIGFAEQVEQRMSAASPEEVRKLFQNSFEKSLENDAFAKSLADKPVTDVRLVSQGQQIRQLWQAGQPWPIYTDNGVTVCRLVSVTKKEKDSAQDESPAEVQP